MTSRTVVVPLSFGLSAVLCVSAAAADDDPPRGRPPVRVYTNEDLERVRPFRDETGVRSVPAVGPEEQSAPADAEKPRGRGESYWRREAERVRQRLRTMESQASDLRASIAEQAAQSGQLLGGRRRSSASLAGNGSTTRLQSRLATLERRMRETEEDLAERARRDGALPGWLRP
jgi:hypothetical protein